MFQLIVYFKTALQEYWSNFKIITTFLVNFTQYWIPLCIIMYLFGCFVLTSKLSTIEDLEPTSWNRSFQASSICGTHVERQIYCRGIYFLLKETIANHRWVIDISAKASIWPSCTWRLGDLPNGDSGSKAVRCSLMSMPRTCHWH